MGRNHCFSYILLLFFFISLSSYSMAEVVKGYVFNKSTAQPIENANVIVVNEKIGSVTDKNGFFEIKLSSGKEYVIEARIIGYKTARQKCFIAAGKISIIYFYLEPDVIEFEPIRIIANKFKEKNEVSVLSLKPREFKQVPSLAETDVLRSVFMLPGINSQIDFSSQFFVRGGNFDQTVIFLDGAPVYNPYHLGGIFGAFYSEILGSATLYAGGNPVDEDGYLSGSLHINTKDYDRTRKATASLLSSGLLSEWELGKGKAIFSVRRTYLDIINRMMDENSNYYFYDIVSKYTIPLSAKSNLSITGFYSKDLLDVLDEEEMNLSNADPPSWGNKIISFHLNSVVNVNSYLESLLFYSNAFIKVHTQNNRIQNSIKDVSIKENFHIRSGSHSLLFGFSLKRLSFFYNWEIYYSGLADIINPVTDVFFDYAPANFRFKKHSFQSAFYFHDEISFNDKVCATFGLRCNYFQLNKRMNFSPRINIEFDPNDFICLRFNYSRFYQYLFTLKEKVNQSIFAPFTTIFPVDRKSDIFPAASNHYIAGLKIKNKQQNLSFSGEIYFKNNSNLITALNPLQLYRHENGFAYGVDLLLKSSFKKFSTWISYSYSVSKKLFENTEYFTSYDRPHAVKILTQLSLDHKWTINFFWVYSTGTPYTPVIGKFKSIADWRDDMEPYVVIDDPYHTMFNREIYGNKNSQRFPSYHRLDIGVSRKFELKNHSAKASIQIINVYNKKNPFFYDYKIQYYNNERKNKNGIPFLPSIAFEIEL